MTTLLVVIAIYLCAGLVALSVLELTTKRISRKLVSAAVETQEKLLATGNLVGQKTAITIVSAALLLFWPTAIYAAIHDHICDKRE